MAEQKKFALGKAPYIRRADVTQNTESMMRDFVIALLPLVIFAFIKNGLLPFINGDTKNIFTMLYPLILIFLGGFTGWLIEFIYFRFIKKSNQPFHDLKNSFSIIPGLLIALILPVQTPIWILVFGCAFATIVGKLLYGGFGRNVFNPALVGYVFIATAYWGLIQNGFFNPSEVSNFSEIVAGATPMTNFANISAKNYETMVAPYGNLWDFFIGTVPGALGETSALLCLVGFVYLLVRRVISWKIPVIYVGTVFVITYIIGAFNGYASDLRYPLFGILSGGLMFGAIFMATEPVTSPKSPNGKILYALFLGVLTVLFRYKSALPEGVATSILAMNLFTLILDNFAAKLRVTKSTRKVIISYVFVGILLLGISAYTVSASIEPKLEETEEISFEVADKNQDYETLDFIYTLTYDTDTVNVVLDKDYTIKSIDNETYNTDEFKVLIEEVILANKLTAYVESATEADGVVTLLIKSKGYSKTILETTLTIAENKIETFTTDLSSQSYDDEHNDQWSGVDPDTLFPEVVEKQDNLDSVEAISGATISSKGIINAAKIAKAYIEEVLINE